MAAKPKDDADEAKAEPTATLTFTGDAALAGTTLSIGHESFPIEDGKVIVPVRLVEAARQAGFR